MAFDDDDLSAVLRRLRGIHDLALRVGWVRGHLRKAAPGDVALMTTLAIARADTGDAQARDLLAALGQAVSTPDLAKYRDAAAEAARASGQMRAAGFLGHSEADQEPDAARVPDFGRGRPLTLGERKSLARKRDRALLARVIRDPHPDVIDILLGNPALTEADVVTLTARRPVMSEVLRKVALHPRWSPRYRVVVALVRNPHTPLEVAIRLTSQLTRQDAVAVANSPDLHAEVRLACRDRLGRGGEAH